MELAGEDNQALISVHNSESPIPGKIRMRIFNSGFSGSNGNLGEGKTYGLGLFIGKEIAEGNEGEMDVRSSRKEGTTFTVRFLSD